MEDPDWQRSWAWGAWLFVSVRGCRSGLWMCGKVQTFDIFVSACITHTQRSAIVVAQYELNSTPWPNGRKLF